MTQRVDGRWAGVLVVALGVLPTCAPSQTREILEPAEPGAQHQSALPSVSPAGAPSDMPPVAETVASTPRASSSPALTSAAPPVPSKTVKGPPGKTIVGPLPPLPQGVAAQIARLRSPFRACYLEGRKKHPDLQGSIFLVAKLGTDGKVLSVGAGGSNLAPIVPCLKKAVAAAQSGLVLILSIRPPECARALRAA